MRTAGRGSGKRVWRMGGVLLLGVWVVVGNAPGALGQPAPGLTIPALYQASMQVGSNPGDEGALRQLSGILESVPDGAEGERFLPPSLEGLPHLYAPQRHLYHLRLLLGKRAYRQGRFDVALRLFASVAEGEFGPRALLYTSAIHVRQHRSVPAIQSLLLALEQLEHGRALLTDRDLLRDIALLSLARIHFDASLVLNQETRSLVVETMRVSAAYKYYQHALPKTRELPRLGYELALLNHYAGSDALEAGLLEVLLSSGFSSPWTGRALLLRVALQLNYCQWELAAADLERYARQYRGSGAQLSALLVERNAGGAGEPVVLLLVEPPRLARGSDTAGPHAGDLSSLFFERPLPAGAPPLLVSIVEGLRGNHRIAGALSWLQRIQGERVRLTGEPVLARSPDAPRLLALLDGEATTVRRILSERMRQELESEREALLEADASAESLAVALRRGRKNGFDTNSVTQAEAMIYGSDGRSNLLLPDRPGLPTDYRHLESGYFHRRLETRCAR